jgi:hypothetical protein
MVNSDGTVDAAVDDVDIVDTTFNGVDRFNQ